MKIAYVTTTDPYNINAYSGSVFKILKTLINAKFEVEIIGNLTQIKSINTDLKRIIYPKIISKKYLIDRSPQVLKAYAQQIKNELTKKKVDLVFSHSSIPIAYLDIEQPIIFWTDATFAGMVDF